MKALTICQPYAELIANGEKLIENRTWATPYRGWLAIHAGKSKAWLDDVDREEHPNMVFGAIVAVARLVDCCELDDLPEHLQAHEHANGPICWVLSDVQRLPEPIPWNGQRGLWDVPNPLQLAPSTPHEDTP